ncbi:MAG: FKBP-type peptidyl-prolyl cis-trans isomerase [Mariprofundaceae bacterium]
MKYNQFFVVVSLALCLFAVTLSGCSVSETDPATAGNAEKGKAFLEENKNKEGVISFPNGMQYMVLKSGSGHQAKMTDTVTVHYRGMHIDGNEFDNSYERGEPLTISLKSMIPGWKKALLLMHEGDTWRLFIPPFLAYTNRGSGSIEPNETLIYEIELLSVNWMGRRKDLIN